MATNPPKNNEIEVTVFGPGVGEAILLHAGEGEWIAIDSCRFAGSKTSASLEYLRALGVDPSTAIRRIVATHWDSDHIKGLSDIVEAAPDAKFICSPLIQKREFRHFLAFQQANPSGAGRTSEISKILSFYESTGRLGAVGPYALSWAGANKTIFRRKFASHSAEIVALSPSEQAIGNSLEYVCSLIPSANSPRKRPIPPTPNQASIALWAHLGQVRILLSGDLEEEGSQHGGWTAIVASGERPTGRASLNKIAHHGSANGYSVEVCTEMLEKPFEAVLTPYAAGRKSLPATLDVRRILGHSPKAFITASPKPKSLRGVVGTVARKMRQAATNIRTLDSRPGYVRMRRSAVDGADCWRPTLVGEARRLCDVGLQ